MELGVDQPIHLAFATTNYDACIELAFEQLGRPILDGFVRSGWTTPQLSPLGIAAQARESPTHVPVLHLHGAVGWYRTDTGVIQQHPPDLAYNATLGTPALLLPDPTKTVDSLTGAETLWDEFRRLLDDSTHVLVLGHSLNDRHLVDVLKTASSPIAVTVHPSEPTGRQRAEALLPGSVPLECTFGEAPVIDQSLLSTWLSSGDIIGPRSAHTVSR